VSWLPCLRNELWAVWAIHGSAGLAVTPAKSTCGVGIVCWSTSLTETELRDFVDSISIDAEAQAGHELDRKDGDVVFVDVGGGKEGH